MPKLEKISNYVDDSIVKSILKIWISNLEPNQLERDESSLKSLKKFVRMAFEVHLKHIFDGDERTRYGVDVLEKIKGDRLNNITKDIQVPSNGDMNLADSVEI